MTARRGNTAITVVISLVALLSAAAMVIDLGWGRLVQQELQVVADAASHGGALQLDGTAAGVTRARSTAQSVAASNPVAAAYGSLTTDEILFGIYNETSKAFTASSDATKINAVRVNARRTGLNLFFAPVAFGRATVNVGADALTYTQLGGASEAACYLPFALPDCEIAAHAGLDNLQNVEFRLNPAGADNLGWGLPNGKPNANSSRGLIADPCSSEPANVGDPVGLQNGVVSSAIKDLADAVNASNTQWDTTIWGAIPAKLPGNAVTTTNYGKTFEGVIPIFDGGTEYCKSSAKWNQSKTIVGFMWAAVFDVTTGGSSSTIRMRIDTTGTRGELKGSAGGGPDWGVTARSTPRGVGL